MALYSKHYYDPLPTNRPAMILYPKYLFAAGFTPLPNLMFIKAQFKHSIALHKHEETHQMQMRRDGLLKFWARYLLHPCCRLAYEVEAYKVSIEYGTPLDVCAVHLANMYYFDITVDQARDLLK